MAPKTRDQKHTGSLPIIEATHRLMFGRTLDGSPCCPWCGRGEDTAGIAGIASPGDDRTWSAIARDHDPTCSWTTTRAFHSPSPIEATRRRAVILGDRHGINAAVTVVEFAEPVAFDQPRGLDFEDA